MSEEIPQVLRVGWCEGKFVLMVTVGGAPTHRISLTASEWESVQQAARRGGGSEIVINSDHKQMR